MRDVARPLADELGAMFEEVDVDADPAVAAEYDLEIPVLCVDGVKAFSIGVSAAKLRRYLTSGER